MSKLKTLLFCIPLLLGTVITANTPDVSKHELQLSKAVATIQLEPKTFTERKLNSIPNGSRVRLADGTYKVTGKLLKAWGNGKKKNITFEGSSPKKVVIDASGLAQLTDLQFGNWDKVIVKNIRFINIRPIFYRCTNSTFDNIHVEGQKVKQGTKIGDALHFSRGKNNTIKNSFVAWTHTGYNAKGITSWRGVNHKFLNNTIVGRLRGGYDLNSHPSEPVSNSLIQGGMIRRDISRGEEDHGIYVHDIAGVVVDGITVTGFSTTSAGGSLKLKNVNTIEVKNNTFHTSGILLRVEKKTWNHLDNIWIHDNVLTGPAQEIQTYTPSYVPRAIVIENNCVPNGTIFFNADINRVNDYSSLAKKNGGVYNNKTGKALKIQSKVNQKNNERSSTCAKAPVPTPTPPGGETDTKAPIGKIVWFRSIMNRKYVCAELATPEAPLETDRTRLGSWEKFNVIDAGNGSIVLQAYRSKDYIKLTGAKKRLTANAKTKATATRFNWVELKNNRVALKVASENLYVQSRINEKDAPLRLNGTKIKGWETFEWGVTTGKKEFEIQEELVLVTENRNQLSIHGLETPTAMHIINMSGQIVQRLSESEAAKGKIDISSLSNGIYILKVGLSRQFKFVKR